jgi:mono/diheme cytochrome c family protein
MKNLNMHIKQLFSAAIVLVLMGSCINEENSPGYEYMPDMYRSPAIEAYVDYGQVKDTLHEEYSKTVSARKPVEGTVPNSKVALNDLPYTLPNTTEGYEKAGEIIKSPFPMSEEIINKGTEIYANFCVHCHGAEGQGNGPVVVKGGHPAPQPYDGPLKDLPEGKMFHTLTYGKNTMGSHASQLTKVERWQVIAYVKTLQNPEKYKDESEESGDGEETQEEEGQEMETGDNPEIDGNQE